jgi:hypothetical protein
MRYDEPMLQWGGAALTAYSVHDDCARALSIFFAYFTCRGQSTPT